MLFSFTTGYFSFLNKKNIPSVAYEGNKLIHHSVVFPFFYKFPFTPKNDIQIGMIDTHTAYRNKGIAHTIVSKILSHYESNVWYITEFDNVKSINLAKKNLFILHSKAYKKKEPSFILDLFNLYKLEF
jgi:hypothetical protein